MKQFFLSALGALVGVSVALAGYDYFILRPRDAQRARTEATHAQAVAAQAQAAQAQNAAALAQKDAAQAQMEAARARGQAEVAKVELGKARNEARGVAAEVEASVERSVDNARKRMDEQAVQMDRRALAADALARATMFRVALAEYYQTNMSWPQDATEVGLPAPAQTRGGAVRSIGVGAQGVITIVLDEHFEPGSTIVLRPSADSGAGRVQWHCETKGDEVLKQALTRC